jgi:hypothetical protein
MKKTHLLPLALIAFTTMGAKGNGCAAEYSPGDGSSATWPTAPVPTPEATTRPMTEAWLTGDNCWKQLVAEATACASDVKGVAGTFDPDRSSCSYASSAELELGGPISTPASGTTLYEATDFRLRNGAGKTCATGKILGVGRTILDVGGKTALLESLTLTKFRLTCPDGKSYGNEVPGTSPNYGLDWLAHRTPGVLLSCTKEQCKLALWGGPTGEVDLAICK